MIDAVVVVVAEADEGAAERLAVAVAQNDRIRAASSPEQVVKSH